MCHKKYSELYITMWLILVFRCESRLMDRGLWHCTGGRDQDHLQEKEMQKGKWLSQEVLKIAEKRREAKAKEKSKDIPVWMQISKNSKERKIVILSDQCKEIEENNRMGKTRDLFKNGHSKWQKWCGPNRSRLKKRC